MVFLPRVVPWVVFAGALVSACSDPSASRGSSHAAPIDVATPTRPSLLESSVRVTGDAVDDAELPLVVALHGRGSDDERFLTFFDDFSVGARILSVRAPIDEGNGRAWWRFAGKSREEIRGECSHLVARVVATVAASMERYPTRGTPVLVGFSQGAMLTYLAAFEHPRAFSTIFPVGGVLFEYWVPPDLPAGFPAVVALHGEADPIISVATGARAADTIEDLGGNARFLAFPEVPHWIMGDLKLALHREIAAALPPTP